MIHFGRQDRMIEGGSWHVGFRAIDWPPFEGPLHRHRGFHELVLCLQGPLSNQVRDDKRKLQAGDMVFIGERDAHQMHGQRCAWVNVAFATPLLGWANHCLTCNGRIAALPESPKPAYARLGLQRLGEIESRLRRIDAKTQGGHSPQFQLALLDMLNELAQANAGRNDNVPTWLNHALSHFNSLPPNEWTRDRLIALCKHSSEHVGRTMRAELQRSPTDHINILRLDHAAAQLLTGDSTVTEIAMAAGFSSLNHFYVRFRRRFGCAPREYRTRHHLTF